MCHSTYEWGPNLSSFNSEIFLNNEMIQPQSSDQSNPC